MVFSLAEIEIFIGWGKWGRLGACPSGGKGENMQKNDHGHPKQEILKHGKREKNAVNALVLVPPVVHSGT